MKAGRFGKFEIEHELGSGAMGRVYMALDPLLERHVALKTISPSLLNSEDTLKRFQREARNAARLQHPNIVTIFEVGEVAGTHYIAMELVEGMELGEAMTPPDRLSVEQKARMVVDICRGLDFAHRMGVIHRDVKPANIRLTREGTVKILDFGIAKSLRGADLTDPNLTQQGMVLGTPSYLSPELVQGHKVDHHADMWAVGVILYEMLAGRRPFEAPTITGLIHRIVSEPPPPLDAGTLRLPDGLAAVAARALEKDRSRRFPDLGAMAKALLVSIGATPLPETPIDPVVRKRAYEANFAEARRLLTEDDLSGALEAAKRAQTLDNTRTAIVSLIRVIEERLRSDTTIKRPPPAPTGSEATRTALQAAARPATLEATPPPLAMPPGPLDTAVLRARGAGAFREAGTFGEPPATREAALSPVADVLAVAGADGAIRLWNLRSRNRASVLRTDLHRRTGHDAAALCLGFSPDGSLLASAHVDGVVHLWDMEKADEVSVRLRHDESVGTLAFSPDGATLATGSLDANLRLWDVGAALAGEARRELLRQPSGVTALAWAGGGEWILTGHSSRVLRLLDPHRSRLLATMRGPEGLVNLLTLSPDGRFMAVASHDRTVRLFDLATREQSAVLAGLRRPATSLCFLGDGGFLATVCQENAVQLWDLETRLPGVTLWGPADESFVGLALFGESNHLAAALADGRIRVWGPAF
ncbi:MAG TPA: serine/threonine-protein kinase [Vicinamibacteria bacterium]|nr:serine/threonine-protein kinase [Vicinamibacteria bacterium]